MRFSKTYLVKTISANRDEHRAIFEEAVDGYKKKLLEELDAYIERIKRNELVYVSIHYPRPDDHTKDYDRVLSMLENTTEMEIELTEGQYSQYVLDEWDWSAGFYTTNSSYSKLAGDKLASLQ